MPIGLIIVIASILGAGIFIIVSSGKPQRQKTVKQQIFYSKAYKFLSAFFLSQQQIIKIYSRLSMLSLYNKYEMAMMATKYYLLSTGISVGLVVVSAILYKDAIFVLISVIFAVLIGNVLVDKQLDKTNLKVYKSLRKAISSIRQEYMKYGDVTEALSNGQYDPILQRPMEEILTILTTSNGELRLQEFYESTPFRTIQTLAGVCYNINNSGDTKDESGQYNFIQALTLISTDVNFEIQRLATQKSKFGYIEYLPFAAVLGCIPLENYFVSIMPGTALMYHGPMGYLSKTVTLIVSMICYIIVSRINSSVAFREDDRDPWTIKMLENKKWNKFITNIIPKGRKGYRRELKLKRVLSKMNLKQFYTKKVVFAAVAFVIAIIAALSTIYLGKSFITTSTQQLSLVATSEMDRYTKTAIQQMDKEYLNSDRVWDKTQLKSLVKTYMPSLSDLQVLDQIKRLEDKKKSLSGAYFKWWYIWLCGVVGLIGWQAPNISILLRRYLVETEAEEDFLQLQTLVSILMNTDIDTLDTLHQLGTHSRIHKDMLQYCYHAFPADPEKELARLQSKTPILEFKRFIGKLSLTISDLSLKEAFSDLIIDREHTIRMREMSIMSALDRRRALCGPLSLLPLGLLVVGELLMPVGVLGFNEFMNALNGLK